MTYENHIPFCEAMVRLMDPLVEIVIHDIQTNQIVYIGGGLSSRKVGDPSLLDQSDLNDLDQIVYPKINFDGRLVKSISLKLEDKWLLCINCDVSVFSTMQNLSEVFLQVGHKPRGLFVNDWQERVHIAIHDYLQNHNLSYQYLTATNKKSVAHHLFMLGAFDEKNAADYIANILSLGRATVFKYLKEWRKK